MRRQQVNRRLVGDQHERIVKKIYESAGWLVERSYGKPVYIRSLNKVVIGKHDFFGNFDLIAIHPDGRVRLLQVTSDSKIKKRIQNMTKVPIANHLKVLVVWSKRKRRYVEFDMNGHIIDEYNKHGEHEHEHGGYQCAVCKRFVKADKVDISIRICENGIEYTLPLCIECGEKIKGV